jgi:hypothetical protein
MLHHQHNTTELLQASAASAASEAIYLLENQVSRPQIYTSASTDANSGDSGLSILFPVVSLVVLRLWCFCSIAAPALPRKWKSTFQQAVQMLITPQESVKSALPISSYLFRA